MLSFCFCHEMLPMLEIIVLFSVRLHFRWRLVKSKQGSISPLTKPYSNYFLVSPFLHSHSLHLPWPFYWMWQQSNVGVSIPLIEGWRLLPAVVLERALKKTEARARRWSWLNYWLSLIGSLYGLWWKQKVTLKARLPLLSALRVSPINLYVPPSPLPFYVQLKALFKWAGVVRLKVPACDQQLNRSALAVPSFPPWGAGGHPNQQKHQLWPQSPLTFQKFNQQGRTCVWHSRNWHIRAGEFENGGTCTALWMSALILKLAYRLPLNVY